MQDKTKNILYVIGGALLYFRWPERALGEGDRSRSLRLYERDPLFKALDNGVRIAGVLSAYQGLKNLGYSHSVAAGCVVAGVVGYEWFRHSQSMKPVPPLSATGWGHGEMPVPYDRGYHQRVHQDDRAGWGHGEMPVPYGRGRYQVWNGMGTDWNPSLAPWMRPASPYSWPWWERATPSYEPAPALAGE